MRAKGIDVSYWQGPAIDWQRVRADGISFAFLRASVGLRVDSTYLANWQRAGAAGILRGSYHYLHPADVLVQAQLFAIWHRPGELPPVVDVEQDGLDGPTVCAFLAEFERTAGCKPMIYTSFSKWLTLVGKGITWAADYELWARDLRIELAGPLLPPPWKEWRFWQVADKGRVDGIAGDVDINLCNGDKEELWRYAAQLSGIKI